jgi:hypothetical protein
MTLILGIRRLPTPAALLLIAMSMAASGCSLDLEYLRSGKRAPDDGGGGGGAGAGGSEPEGGQGGVEAGVGGAGGSDVVDADASEPERPDVSEAGPRALRVVFGSVHRSSPLAPSDGGNPYNDICQPDGVIVGADGSNDPSSFTTAPRSLQTFCGTISVAAATGSSYVVTTSLKTILPLHGDHPGPNNEDARCPDNTVVVGVETRSGMWVDQLKLQCAPLTVSGGPDMYTLSVGSISYPLMAIGGPGGSPAPSITCPSGEIVVAFYVNAGDFLDSFSIGCAKPSLEFEL